ncbi:MAG: thioredoxin-dependent thiol peroxidase [Flexibacteraceae bacterium]
MALQVNDPAPDFTAKDQNGATITLSSFRGKKVVLYFYPKDDTPGCTKQACNLRDNNSVLQDAGYQVIGVSIDDEKAHTKFINKYELNFPLVADTDKGIVEAYGVWVEKSMYGKKYFGTARVTFVINEEGVITKIIDKVKVDDHAAQILA